MANTVIGRVVATEKNPTTIDNFTFWTDPELILNPFDIVKVQHVNNSFSYGVIEDIAHITDAASFLTNFISSDFGDVNAEENTLRVGMNYVSAKVVCNTENIYIPLQSNAKVMLATAEEINYALGLNDIRNPLVCGYLEMYDGTKGCEKVTLPVNLNSKFIIGPEGAHLNISGISGLASKTSYAMFLLKAIQDSYMKKGPQNDDSEDSVAFVLFNVKGKDLLAIDQVNDFFDERNPEQARNETFAKYEQLGLSAEPFKNVHYYYPYSLPKTRHWNTYMTPEEVADNIKKKKAKKYKYIYNAFLHAGRINQPVWFYKQFLGYRKGADGFPEVVPEEAAIVRRIYTRFIAGLTPGAIAKELTADGIPTASRKQRWQTSTVESILQNEKYKGAALLQKCFTVDFLTKKQKVNEGEVPQYYVEHSHEPIITPEEFDKVQTELARRKQISRQYSGKSIFSSRIVCGDCGSYFGSKVWNSTSKYRRVIWQCNGKFKGEHKCETPHLDEETIKARFVAALNAIIESKDNILEDCRLMQATLTDCTGIDTEIESLLEEIDVVTELTKRCIAENSQTAQNQEEYAARYNGFVERYEKAKAQLEQLRATKTVREAQAEAIGAFMFEVQELDTITDFDEKLWLTIIDTVTVHTDGRMTFRFQGGKTLTSY